MKDLTNEQISSIWHAQAASGGRSFEDIIRAAIKADRELNGRAGEPADQVKGREAVATVELTNSQIMASIGRHAGGEKTAISESRPLGQQWEQVCELVRKIVKERYYTTPPAQPALEWVEPTDEKFHEAWNEHAAKIDREFNTSSNQNFFAAGWLAHGTKLREKNAGQPAADDSEVDEYLASATDDAGQPLHPNFKAAAMNPWQIMPTVKDRATNRELPVVGVYENVVFVDVPAADDKAGGEPVAWREFLARMEWSDWRYDRYGQGQAHCPDCGNQKEDGHGEDCELSAMLYTHPQPQAEVRVPEENRCIRELREYAEKNPGTYIFPGWDGNRVTNYLAAAPKQQDDLPAILKKQAS